MMNKRITRVLHGRHGLLCFVFLSFVSGCTSFQQNGTTESAAKKPVLAESLVISDKPEYRFSTNANADELYRLGRSAYQSGYDGQAMSLFKAALKLEPRHTDSRNGMAVILHSRNRHDEALELIRIALEHDPKSELLLRNQARVKAELVAKSNSGTQVSDATGSNSPTRIDATPKSSGFVQESYGAYRLVQVQPNVYELKVNPKAAVTVSAYDAPSALAPDVKISDLQPLPAIPAPLMALGRPQVAGRATTISPSIKTVVNRSRRETLLNRDPKVLIANGKGERGLACREARSLVMQGWKARGCIDHVNFTQKRSVIYFLSGQEDAAKKVRSSLLASDSIELRRVNYLINNADVQVLIGHDWSKARLPQKPST
jgi:Tetratricopeptide repeat/LytR cell envelope-related transcriptional attenuator